MSVEPTIAVVKVLFVRPSIPTSSPRMQLWTESQLGAKRIGERSLGDAISDLPCVLMLFCAGPLSKSDPESQFYVGLWGLSRGGGKINWNQGTSAEVCTNKQNKKQIDVKEVTLFRWCQLRV